MDRTRKDDKDLEILKNLKVGISGTLIILGIILYGIIGSYLIMDLNLFDSIYYTIITIATVGYGDITPVTPIQKIFFD